MLTNNILIPNRMEPPPSPSNGKLIIPQEYWGKNHDFSFIDIVI